MKLYYHKTDGGAEYLMDNYMVCPNGDKEGTIEGSKYVVRIDGNIEKDCELNIKDDCCPVCKDGNIDYECPMCGNQGMN